MLCNKRKKKEEKTPFAFQQTSLISLKEPESSRPSAASIFLPRLCIDTLSCLVEMPVIAPLSNGIILLFYSFLRHARTHTHTHTHTRRHARADNEIIARLKCIFSVHLAVSMWGSAWCWYTALWALIELHWWEHQLQSMVVGKKK